MRGGGALEAGVRPGGGGGGEGQPAYTAGLGAETEREVRSGTTENTTEEGQARQNHSKVSKDS